jgi:hypothetical protein
VLVTKPPQLAGLDWALVALTLALAFLIASTAVRTTDFYRHLAAGRLISQGHYPFGTDPFASSMEGISWIDHSWLFSFLVYLVYQLPGIGPAAVVVVKAVLVVLLAELMLRSARRKGQSLWLPVAGTLLALVTLAPHLQLSARCASYLGLGLVVWLLEQSRERPRLAWLVPVVCLLWVNLDEWFVLGPLTVALYLAGQLLQSGPASSRDGRARLLVGVLAASVVACLINPYFPTPWRVLELPVELSPASFQTGLRDDAQFRGRFLSPLQRDYLDPGVGLSVAGIAYFVLLVLTGASFALSRNRWPFEHLLLAAVLGGLSLAFTHLIPFFAIVAGPILAQNFLSSTAAQNEHWTIAWRRWALIGRGLTLVAAGLLMVAVIPGWLHARPYERHRLAWTVRSNPSLEEAAKKISEWQQNGKLPARRYWLNLAPEVADYLAWHCPTERAWMSWSILTTPEVAHKYLEVRQALQPASADPLEEMSLAGSEEERRAVWQQFLREQHMPFVICYIGGSGQRLSGVLRRLLGEKDVWTTCALEGQAGIFGWQDPQASDATRQVILDLELPLDRMAFGSLAQPAPAQGLDEEPTPIPWWEQLWRPGPDINLDRDTAAMHQQRFQARGPFLRRSQATDWQAMTAASALGTSAGIGPLSLGTLLNLGQSCAYHDYPIEKPVPMQELSLFEKGALNCRAQILQRWDAGPADSLYLGIRAARRALADSPNDPNTSYLLGEAYYQLGQRTREASLVQTLDQRGAIRLIQAATAFNDALRLGPSLLVEHDAHARRAELFGLRGYLDLETQERQEQLRCARALGPSLNEDAEVYNQHLEQLDRYVEELQKRLSRNRNFFEVQGARRSLGERFQLALQFGLVESACDLLLDDLKEKMDESSQQKLNQAARLKLYMGRAGDAEQLLTPEGDSPTVLRQVVLDPWLYVELALARGRYQQADDHLVGMLERHQKSAWAQQVGSRIGNALLLAAPGATGIGLHPVRLQGPAEIEILRGTRIALETLQREAELHLFRGWIAVEAGAIDRARTELQAARKCVAFPEAWGRAVNRLGIQTTDDITHMRLLGYQQGEVEYMASLYLHWIRQAH